MKRSFDIVFSTVGLLVLWPFIVITALYIRVKSGPPVLYTQFRVGKNGELFKCVKFRTMTVDAEKYGSVTCSSDGRITAEGKFLRKYKLDELTQLWNVFTGKMSFVGPRPDVPGYADKLPPDQKKILSLRPGITGPATIYFRYEEQILSITDDPQTINDSIIWPAKIRMNLEYLNNWSLFKDIGYILITLFPVLNNWLKLVDSPPENPQQVIK